MLDYNVNFKGRLVIDGITQNKSRWKNIAKIFKEETKGINYESRVFSDTGVLEIFVDRFERKNRAYDYISTLETREAILSEQGTKKLLAKSDRVIAKVLAKHLQFVQKLDESCKSAEEMIDKAYNYVYNIFQKNGFDPVQTNYVKEMFENIYAMELGTNKVLPEYKALKKLPGFNDAQISHMNCIRQNNIDFLLN